MPTRFRLTLDPPYIFSTEPGYYRSSHCFDMRTSDKNLDKCYQDPLTGLIMLVPSHLTDDYHNSENWVKLSQLTYETAYWTNVYRNYDLDDPDSVARFWSTQDIGTGVANNLVSVTRLLQILDSQLVKDYLVWVLESSFDLGADEGFVWHYRALADEHSRPRNWFALSWAGLYLHFSTDGVMRAYRYPISGGTFDYTQNSEPIASFQFGTPSDIINRDGTFTFIPIPRYGLAIYHNAAGQSLNTRSSSASSVASRGFLLELPLWEDTYTTGTGDVLLPASKIAVAVNRSLLRMQHLFGMHRITYPASGTVLDSIFEPGFNPSTLPDTAASPVFTKPFVSGSAGILTAARTCDDDAEWAVGGERQGRFKATLTTSDSRYTPFMLAGNVQWEPIFTERATTPVVLSNHSDPDLPDRLQSLQFSDDEMGRFEGEAMLFVQSAEARKIITRGDMTFTLEKSFDEGETWINHAGGLARVEGDVQAYITGAGLHYFAKITMVDMFARFRETSVLWETAFDGNHLEDAINRILLACGMSPLAFAPLLLATLKLPDIPKGENWRFAPKVNDHGDELIRSFLLLARGKNREFRMRHKWVEDDWIIEAKPRDMAEENLWHLTPFDDEVTGGAGFDGTGRTIRIGEDAGAFSFAPSPPEANLVRPFGLTGTNPNDSEKIPCPPIENVPSLEDPASRDYLGRVISAAPMFASVSEIIEIYRMGYRVFDAACHHRLKMRAVGRDFVDSFGPLARVIVRGLDANKERADLFGELWVKKRITTIDYREAGEIAPTVSYYMDSSWESEIK